MGKEHMNKYQNSHCLRVTLSRAPMKSPLVLKQNEDTCPHLPDLQVSQPWQVTYVHNFFEPSNFTCIKNSVAQCTYHDSKISCHPFKKKINQEEDHLASQVVERPCMHCTFRFIV